MTSGKYEECKTCYKRNNKLACLLHECEIRERYNKELFRKWHREWAEKKCCFACVHCRCKWTYEHSNRTTVDYCELTGELILSEQTCEKFEEGERVFDEE